jgi:tetratricopeptide (TPR) repeat protein
MNHGRKVMIISGVLVAALFAGSVISRLQVESIRGPQATLDETLYLPSGKTVKRLSLGYYSLLADIYWTRAVQYFGARHYVRSVGHYELLYPLLDITTDLDPKLIVAYENGSIFLSQRQPEGAGQPDKAAALVEKGIRANPTYWRLYFTLGFIHYTDRHDYKAASEAFQKGSEIPGALPWMKVMAARMAEKGDDPTTATYLWKTIYDTTTDKTIKDTAAKHLLSLQADLEMDELERRTQAYHERFKKYPEEWSDLIRAGLLAGIPADPTHTPYNLRLDGTVRVANEKDFPYLERHGAKENK